MFCWLIGHNWVGGYDPHFQSCTRCDKVRPKKFKGARECPYCSRPVNTPIESPLSVDPWNAITNCVHCGKKLKWHRGYSHDTWPDPELIIDFKMELGEIK